MDELVQQPCNDLGQRHGRVNLTKKVFRLLQEGYTEIERDKAYMVYYELRPGSSVLERSRQTNCTEMNWVAWFVDCLEHDEQAFGHGENHRRRSRAYGFGWCIWSSKLQAWKDWCFTAWLEVVAACTAVMSRGTSLMTTSSGLVRMYTTTSLGTGRRSR
uniref:Uncharacterized protein n=1 Tax=Arundo donax TaxID=35708 RepID=A0A0A9HKC5_ARUDO